MYSKEQGSIDSRKKDDYLVATKVLLSEGDKLLITHDIYGQWDIPDERI